MSSLTPPLQWLRILNDITWQPLLEGDHPSTVAGPTGVVVYREVDETAPSQASPSMVPRSPGGREVRPAGGYSSSMSTDPLAP